MWDGEFHILVKLRFLINNCNQIPDPVADQTIYVQQLLIRIPWEIHYYWWCNIQHTQLGVSSFSAEVVAKCCSKPLQISLPGQHHNDTSILTFWRGYFKDKKIMCIYLIKRISLHWWHIRRKRTFNTFTGSGDLSLKPICFHRIQSWHYAHTLYDIGCWHDVDKRWKKGSSFSKLEFNHQSLSRTSHTELEKW